MKDEDQENDSDAAYDEFEQTYGDFDESVFADDLDEDSFSDPAPQPFSLSPSKNEGSEKQTTAKEDSSVAVQKDDNAAGEAAEEGSEEEFELDESIAEVSISMSNSYLGETGDSMSNSLSQAHATEPSADKPLTAPPPSDLPTHPNTPSSLNNLDNIDSSTPKDQSSNSILTSPIAPISVDDKPGSPVKNSPSHASSPNSPSSPEKKAKVTLKKPSSPLKLVDRFDKDFEMLDQIQDSDPTGDDLMTRLG